MQQRIKAVLKEKGGTSKVERRPVSVHDHKENELQSHMLARLRHD